VRSSHAISIIRDFSGSVRFIGDYVKGFIKLRWPILIGSFFCGIDKALKLFSIVE